MDIANLGVYSIIQTGTSVLVQKHEFISLVIIRLSRSITVLLSILATLTAHITGQNVIHPLWD